MIGDDRIPVVCNSDRHEADVFLTNLSGGTFVTRSRSCRAGTGEYAENRTVKCPLCRQTVAMTGATIRAIDAMVRSRPDLLTAVFSVRRNGDQFTMPALSATILHGLAVRAGKMSNA